MVKAFLVAAEASRSWSRTSSVICVEGSLARRQTGDRQAHGNLTSAGQSPAKGDVQKRKCSYSLGIPTVGKALEEAGAFSQASGRAKTEAGPASSLVAVPLHPRLLRFRRKTSGQALSPHTSRLGASASSSVKREHTGESHPDRFLRGPT